MFRVDKRRVGRFRGVVPFACGALAGGVLRRGNDLEVVVLQFFVKRLPTWQIKSAASPGGPGHEQHFLPAEFR